MGCCTYGGNKHIQTVGTVTKRKALAVAWLGALLLLLPLASYAGRVAGLYSAEVPVSSQDPQERTEAIHLGFLQVLVKVTGESSVGEMPGISGVLDQAERYVLQYRYEEHTEPAAVPGGEPNTLRTLKLRFDPTAVDVLLRKSGLPVWGDQRPSVLVWLAVEQGAQRFLVGEDSKSETLSALQEAAARRGVPILLPLLDLKDQSDLPVADVWGNFGDSILKASSRYTPDAVLVGRLYRRSDGRWDSTWTLYQGDTQLSWTAGGTFSAQVINEGFDGAVDRLAARFAPTAGTGPSSEFLVDVDGIASLQTYARVSKYLHSLQPIESVVPWEVTPTHMVFRATIAGGYRPLQQVIGLSNVLVPVAAPTSATGEKPDVGSETRTLHYRLGP